MILINGSTGAIADAAKTVSEGPAMIVCSCNVISDGDVRAVVGRGSPGGSTAQIYRGLGREPQCGRCAGSIRKIMDEGSSAGGDQR